MQKYNRRLLRYIKKNFDYQTYIDEHLNYTATSSEEIRIDCPFCGESDQKMYVNNEKKYFNCFKCEASNRNSDVFDFIAEVENISVRDAIERTVLDFREVTPEELEDFVSDYDEPVNETQDEFPFKKAKQLESLPKEAVPILAVTEESEPFVNYLKDRGFTMDDILACNTHYISTQHCHIFKSTGKYAGNIGQRILFPVYGGNNYLVSWLARDIIGSAKQKYINAPESDMAKTVWPFVPPKGETIVIVEGLIDALAVRKTGYYSYATFGKKLSEEQLSIFKYWKVEKLIIFLDANAKREMKTLVESTRYQFKSVYVVDVSHWPIDNEGKTVDSGFFLANPDKLDILKATLDNRVDVSNEWEYAKWQMI